MTQIINITNKAFIICFISVFKIYSQLTLNIFIKTVVICNCQLNVNLHSKLLYVANKNYITKRVFRRRS